jgi:hypothetical protein
MPTILRVRGEPFFITGRGLAVTCEFEAGEARLGFPATATIEIPGGAPLVEAIIAVEAALDRSTASAREWPALIFAVDRPGERAELLRQLLRPGVRISLTGPATELLAAPTGSPRRSRPPGSLRTVRWLEGLYAALSLFFALSLPWPPSGPYLALWLHFVVTAVVAAVLAWQLSPGSRLLFVLGLILSGYTVINAGIRLPEVLRSSAQSVSIALGLLPLILQLISGALIFLAWRSSRRLALAT